MCQPDKETTTTPAISPTATTSTTTTLTTPMIRKTRRAKRDKSGLSKLSRSSGGNVVGRTHNNSSSSSSNNNNTSGGLSSLFPSLIGVSILIFGLLAKMGFRGRASVAGIDLGTTNSVICVQAPAKGLGVIDCIPDPESPNNSPIVPSVVSFLELSERPIGPSSKTKSLLVPHPSTVLVGQKAKKRIDSHPHHTLYNAKRVLGRRPDDPAVRQLREEVEFQIHDSNRHDDGDGDGVVEFHVPESHKPILPEQVGSYIVHHLIQITNKFLRHENIKSAVICVPAKFDRIQREKTVRAFKDAGIAVARILEEPTAAALAYGLHRKQGVDYILVYDFGGGTLDVSLLHVTDGFVDVMGSDGDDRLGGADFDAAIAHFLMEQRGGKNVIDSVQNAIHYLQNKYQNNHHDIDLEQTLAHACPALTQTPLCTASSFHTISEQLKISMSNVTNGDGRVEGTCLGLDPTWGVHENDRATLSKKDDTKNRNYLNYSPDEEKEELKSFCQSLHPEVLSVTLTEFQSTVQHLLDRSAAPIQRLLVELGLEEDQIDEVVMVGGTSRMPQIRSLVQNVIPSASLNTHIDPDITVAYGAASVID